MKRTPIPIRPEDFPPRFQPLLEIYPVYDSSCSPDARVLYLETEEGMFLKSAPKGSLAREAEMIAYFHAMELAPEVLAYESDHRDWLLTKRLSGEDCLHPQYLAEPKRLCDALALQLRNLHDTVVKDSPGVLTQARLEQTMDRHRAGHFTMELFRQDPGFSSPQEAMELILKNGPRLRSDILIHGDYCLPNILLDNWQFSGFIDVGGGGLGDRHFDLFWGLWSLDFNLKDPRLASRFLDVYGRDKVDLQRLRTVAAMEAFG